MEVASIVSLVLIITLGLERIFKHFKKSTCCGSSVEFDNTASAPDLTNLLKK
jgi:hypothetical protein